MRSAAANDFHAIRALIRTAQINPTGLDWRRFVVAVDQQGKVIGCGQVKPHRDRQAGQAHELASIAVTLDWRERGVGSAIIERLIVAYSGPLYLTCRASLEPFYARFGFHAITGDGMPPYFQRVRRVATRLRKMGIMKEELLVMVRG